MVTVRIPLNQELAQLMDYLKTQGYADYDAVGLVQQAAITVLEAYITDSPGYVGNVMVVVWSNAPDLYEAFIWRAGQLVHLDQDPTLRLDTTHRLER